MILVDTHVVLWLASERRKLSPVANQALLEGRMRHNGLAVADITMWELAMLGRKRRIEAPGLVEEFLLEVERHYVVLRMDSKTAIRAHAFSDMYPKDPADRIIGATALTHGISLVTADGLIRASGEVPCVW